MGADCIIKKKRKKITIITYHGEAYAKHTGRVGYLTGYLFTTSSKVGARSISILEVKSFAQTPPRVAGGRTGLHGANTLCGSALDTMKRCG